MSEAATSRKERIQGRVASWFTHAALWISSVLPLSWARAMGRWAGQLTYWLDGRTRRVAERNIRLVYPELDSHAQEALIRDSLIQTGMLAAEMGHVWRKPWSHTRNLIQAVEGADLIEKAQADGRGVIVLGPHLGNWEVLGLHLATLGDMVALYEPPRFAALGTLIRAARERSGGTLVPTTSRGIAALVRSVRRGGISGILPDQVPDDPRAGVNVPFMGHDAFTATLACNLIQRSGAVAVMGAAFRVPGGFKVCYRQVPDALYDEDPVVALTALNSAVAALISGWDAQYQWQYKRFRCRPPGPVDHYIDLMQPRT